MRIASLVSIAPLAACSLVSLDALDEGAGGGATSAASTTSATSASGSTTGTDATTAVTSSGTASASSTGGGAGEGGGGGAGTGGGGGSSSSAYADAVLASGPVLFLRLGERAGETTAHDETGNHDGFFRTGAILGMPGALVGDPSTAVAPSVDVVPHGAVDVGDVLDFASGGPSPFSLECWIFIDEPSNVDGAFQVLLDKDAILPGGDRVGYLLALFPQEDHWALGFERFAAGAGMLGQYPFTVPVPEDAWHHVVATFQSAGVTLYLDGEVISSASGSADLLADTPASLLVGATSLGNYPFDGVIDEVAIYDRALGPGEVAEHFAVGTGAR